jgi:hypothetical protein
MKTLFSTLLSNFGLIFLAGCASSGTVVVRTDPPDAKVFMVDIKSGQNSLLGSSPLTFKKNIDEAKGAEVLHLRLEKEGFESKFTSVATISDETTFLDVKLSTTLSANNEVRKAFEVNRQLMNEAARLAAGKRFSEALVRIEKVLEVDPKNDEAYAAKGSLMFLMKDYEGAQSAWRKSLEINPSNDVVRAALVDLNISMDTSKRVPAQTREQPR